MSCLAVWWYMYRYCRILLVVLHVRLTVAIRDVLLMLLAHCVMVSA